MQNRIYFSLPLILAQLLFFASHDLLAQGSQDGNNTTIILQSTTSTQNSGLLDFILPKFKKQTGITVRVVAVGTGQALENARNGNGDVLLVHAKTQEEKFVKAGYGLKRYNVMYNDFIIVGPINDPAKILGVNDILKALKQISNSQTSFVSRGDRSGTHSKEMLLWRAAKVDPVRDSGKWYREAGAGMGTTLNIAVGMGAYCLTDRATWIAFNNKGGHKILAQNDDRLFNQYGVILVNPSKHAHVQAKAGQSFIRWLTGSKGQSAIASFRIKNQQLFFPNAEPQS